MSERRGTRAAPAAARVTSSLARDAVSRDATRIVAERTTRGCVIYVSGEIDIATSPQLQRALDEAIEASDGPLVVDLSAVGFIDVSGLRVLRSTVRRAGARKFGVASPSAAVRRLLEITGIDLPTLR
ncbi:MAG: STAS domain-containing protein [Solirubrobacteraceae bacterium]